MSEERGANNPLAASRRIAVAIFGVIFVACLFAELIANDRPILLIYKGEYLLPILHDYPEEMFGGFLTSTDYRDPFNAQTIAENGGRSFWPPIHFSYRTVNVELPMAPPSKPTWLLTPEECQRALEILDLRSCGQIEVDWLGTDDQGRDVLARLIYGVRFSLLFGLAVSLCWLVVCSVFGGGGLAGLPTVFAGSMLALIAVDSTGFGFPPGWPSLGQMLYEAEANPEAPWLVIAAWVTVTGLLAGGYLVSRALVARFSRKISRA